MGLLGENLLTLKMNFYILIGHLYFFLGGNFCNVCALFYWGNISFLLNYHSFLIVYFKAISHAGY